MQPEAERLKRKLLADLRRRWRKAGAVPPWPELWRETRRLFSGPMPDDPLFASFRRASAARLPDDALTGDILECYLRERESGGLSLRRKTGSFYTPADVAEAMVEQALPTYLAGRLELPETALAVWRGGGVGATALPSATRRRMAALILNMRVIDPACGAGAFLLAFLRVASDWLERAAPSAAPGAASRRKKRLVRRCCGVDLREEALEVAAFRLRNRCPGAAARLICADALTMRELDGKFDLVTGNPPYVSYGLRRTAKLGTEARRLLREQYPCAAQYKISTYALFMELAVRLTAPGGAQCLIVPDSFLAGRYFAGIRRMLFQEGHPVKFFLVEENLFAAAVGRSVIYVERKGERLRAETTLFRRVMNRSELRDGAAGFAVAPSDCVRGAFARIRFYGDAREKHLVETMERGAEPLRNYLVLASGLIAGQGQSSIISPVRHSSAWRPGISSGRLIHAGCPVEPDCFLCTDPERIKSGLGKIDYARAKLLLRQTGDRLVAAVDERGLYALNNVHLAAPRPGREELLYFFACLLNSAMMNDFYRIVSMEQKRVLAQVDLDLLAELPVKMPTGDWTVWRELYRRLGSAGARKELEKRLAELYSPFV